jgi:Gram-negative bacterial TonB protein C-terminal
MRFMRLVAIALAAVCGIAMAAAPKPPQTFDMWLQGTLDIDETGRVLSLQWEHRSKAHRLVAEQLAPMISNWEFEPAKADGRAAAAQTGLLIKVLVDERDDGSVALRLADVITGMTVTTRRAPEYPGAAARHGVSAVVTAVVDVAGDGKPVIRDLVYESDDGKDEYREMFLASATQAIPRWTYRPEIVAGRGVQATVRIPIEFCIDGSSWCVGRREKRIAELAQQRVLPAGVYTATSSEVLLKTGIREQSI